MCIRNILFSLFVIVASGCASGHSFKNQEEFESYVSHLGLSGIAVPSAMSKVTAEGFTCYPQKNSIYCVREIKELVCIQKQIISLPSLEVSQTPFKISSNLGLVCL